MKRLKRTETGGEERERAGEGTSEMHVKKKYPWLRYSPSEDASHCCVRVLFNIQKGSNAVFQREGLRDWENAVGEKRGIISNHGDGRTFPRCVQRTKEKHTCCHQSGLLRQSSG